MIQELQPMARDTMVIAPEGGPLHGLSTFGNGTELWSWFDGNKPGVSFYRAKAVCPDGIVRVVEKVQREGRFDGNLATPPRQCPRCSVRVRGVWVRGYLRMDFSNKHHYYLRFHPDPKLTNAGAFRR